MHKVRSFIYFQPSAGNDSIVLFSTFTPFLAAGLARTLAASSPMSSSPDALAPVAACNAILLRKLSFVAKSQLICHEITVLLRNHSFVTKSQVCRLNNRASPCSAMPCEQQMGPGASVACGPSCQSPPTQPTIFCIVV